MACSIAEVYLGCAIGVAFNDDDRAGWAMGVSTSRIADVTEVHVVEPNLESYLSRHAQGGKGVRGTSRIFQSG